MKTIAQLIEIRASKEPDKVFLRFENETVTFGDLKIRVAQTAASLRAFGLVSGDRVGLMMANHPDHLFLYLALSWLGATSIEFGIHLKRLGLETQLRDAEPRFVFADAAFAGELEPAARAAGCLEGIVWHGDREPVSPLSYSLDDVLMEPASVCVEPANQLDRIQAI
ncbi:MAG: acyl--CoA ligase, partial [Pseudomonadales bacterium]|nr:acyl--CoA ligase [Pseudomonadales bacterium]